MPSKEHHYINKSSWIRAATLGANDGILSTSSLIVGVAAAGVEREALILAALAGAVAGAMAMASGEYVSVSAQADLEKGDLARELEELQKHPEEELRELSAIYETRGLSPEMALAVSRALTKHNALEAHARDELGINDFRKARPFQAAIASFLAFLGGALLPFLLTLLAPLSQMITWQYAISILALMLLGALAAKTSGAKMIRAMVRICLWGTFAMLCSALVGHLW